MSQTTPFGTPLDPPSGPAGPVDPSVATAKGSGSRRTLLIAGGSAVVLAAAGAAAFVLLSGASDEPTTLVLPKPRTSTSAGVSPTASPELSVLPTDVVVNARNPFLRPPSETPSASGTGGTSGSGGGGGGVTTVTVKKTYVETGPTSTVKKTATVRSTATAASTAVYLALFDLDAGTGANAQFRVSSAAQAGTLYVKSPGQKFGANNAFHYTVTTVVDSATCAKVTYVDEEFVICKGDLIKVH